MTVIPELERMLFLQASRLAHGAGPLAEEDGGVPQRSPRLRAGRRWGALALVAVVAGAGAVGATEAWEPFLGGGRAGQSTLAIGPPSAEALKLLGVLRRPQTDADRDAQIRRVLNVPGRTIQGVRTPYVRNVEPNLAGSAAALMPADRAGTEEICVLYPVVESGRRPGTAPACWTPARIRAGRAYEVVQVGSAIHVYGVVPDGVASVQVVTASGADMTVPARANFFDATTGGPMSPHVVNIVWRDRAGHRVGPSADSVSGG